MSPSPHQPTRTCVGCRGRAPQKVLLRVAVPIRGPANQPRLDAFRTQGGRGCWLHASVDCWGKATARKAFGRALRISGTVDLTALVEDVGRAIQCRQAESESQADGSSMSYQR